MRRKAELAGLVIYGMEGARRDNWSDSRAPFNLIMLTWPSVEERDELIALLQGRTYPPPQDGSR